MPARQRDLGTDDMCVAWAGPGRHCGGDRLLAFAYRPPQRVVTLTSFDISPERRLGSVYQ
jgi:hypothetical protein